MAVSESPLRRNDDPPESEGIGEITIRHLSPYLLVASQWAAFSVLPGPVLNRKPSQGLGAALRRALEYG